ncbi:MAG: N-acetyltransferase [Oscillospiraceae bacterium]
MELSTLASYKELLPLYRGIYGGDANYRDNKTSLLPLVCGPDSAFRQNSRQEIVAVKRKDSGEILCQCVLIRHKHYADTLVMAFFEGLPGGGDAVKKLEEHAKSVARTWECTKLVAGLDGHCNYSVGFLTDHFDDPPSFGQAYNPPAYNEWFRGLGWREVGLFSLREKIPQVNTKVFERARRMSPEISFEYADFGSGFSDTMNCYTDLSNEIFTDHRYCFLRERREDYELFAPMRPLLKPDNMIFAVENGRTVGFLFWYPDFNELVGPGKGAGVGTFLRHRLLGKMPKQLKVVEIGVLPEYKKKGLILLLFGELARIAAERYPKIEYVISSWILEENLDSGGMSSKILHSRYKGFSAYEKEV